MTVKNILVVGALGLILIYLGSQQKKSTNSLNQETQYGGYQTHPMDDWKTRYIEV